VQLVKWYRVSESILGNLIPHLTDDEISSFISNNKWLVIPTKHEFNKKDSVNRPDPSIYINVSRRREIGLGIVCNTLTSIERMRNILHTFHTLDKEELVERLNGLDDGFVTSLERKVKKHHYTQTPVYGLVLEIPSNRIDSSSISGIFERVDQILDEGRQEMKQRGIHWRPVLPHMNLAITWMELNEDVFRGRLGQLKTIYEIVLRIKTDKEIKDEEKRLKKEQITEKQRRFTEFVEELKRRNVSGEEYRRRVSEWCKENPLV